MIRQWRERVELIPDLPFFAGVSGPRDLRHSRVCHLHRLRDSLLTLFQRFDALRIFQKCAQLNSSSRTQFSKIAL